MRPVIRPLLGVAALAAVFIAGVAYGLDRGQGGPAVAATTQPAACSVATLNGGYGVQFEGTSRALGRYASVSVFRFDGTGGFSAEETFSSEMQKGARSIAGSYRVEDDCTATLLYGSQLGRPHEVQGACVVADGGRSFSCVDTAEGWVALGTGVKQ